MGTVLFLGFALAYLVLLVWGLRLASRHGWWTPANLPLLVLAALVYDLLIESGAATNAFELVLLISIMATKAFQDREEAEAGRGRVAEGRTAAELRR